MKQAVFILCIGSICALGAPSNFGKDQDLQSSLIARWTFNEAVSTNVFDYSGHGLTGYLTNSGGTAAFGTGIVGTGVAVSLGGLALIPMTAGLSGTFTMTCWANVRDWSPLYGTLFSAYVDTPSQTWIIFNSQATAHSLSFSLYDGVNNPGVFFNNAVTNYWWFLVGIRDTTAHTVSFYTNAVLCRSTPDTIATVPAYHSIQIGNNPALNRPSTAWIDDCRIYSKALTAAQIRELYNQGYSTP